MGYFNRNLEDELKSYCKMTGKSEEEVRKEALYHFLSPYFADKGYPQEAVYLEGATPYERQVARNEGRRERICEVPCYILKKSKMFGNEYYQILVGDKLMKVPSDVVVARRID